MLIRGSWTATVTASFANPGDRRHRGPAGSGQPPRPEDHGHDHERAIDPRRWARGRSAPDDGAALIIIPPPGDSVATTLGESLPGDSQVEPRCRHSLQRFLDLWAPAKYLFIHMFCRDIEWRGPRGPRGPVHRLYGFSATHGWRAGRGRWARASQAAIFRLFSIGSCIGSAAVPRPAQHLLFEWKSDARHR